MIYRFAKCLFWLYFNIFNRLKIIGADNIIQSGSLIVYANHFSDADVFLLPLCFKRQIKFMAKKSLFETPVVKYFVKAYGAFPVNRDSSDIAAIKTALKILRNEELLGIFPEGRRVRDIKDSNPKGGFAMLAHKTSTPLQPVRIKYKRKLMIFNSIEIIIGKVIDPNDIKIDDTSSDGYAKASRKLMATVYGLG